MSDSSTGRVADDAESEADQVARVAALVARAGLKLKANEIADLVSAYRKDRAGFERLRAMVADVDEPVHTFRTSRRSDPSA